jgi:hypothetical protein
LGVAFGGASVFICGPPSRDKGFAFVAFFPSLFTGPLDPTAASPPFAALHYHVIDQKKSIFLHF